MCDLDRKSRGGVFGGGIVRLTDFFCAVYRIHLRHFEFTYYVGAEQTRLTATYCELLLCYYGSNFTFKTLLKSLIVKKSAKMALLSSEVFIRVTNLHRN